MTRDIRTAAAAFLQMRYGTVPHLPADGSDPEPWEVDGKYLVDAANLLGILGDEFPAVAQVVDAEQVRVALQRLGAHLALQDGISPQDAADADSPAVVGTELDDTIRPAWGPIKNGA